MNINEKLAKVQTEFKAKKSRYNSFGKYHFRSAEDILEAIKPFLIPLKLSVSISESMVDYDVDFPIMQSKATLFDAESNESVSATAIVGVDLQQKGMQMPQKFGSASSYGKKYALGNLFLIDDTADADATNNHGKAASTKAKPKSTITSVKDPAYPKAVEFIKNGGKLAAITAKYDVSKEIEAKLKTL